MAVQVQQYVGAKGHDAMSSPPAHPNLRKCDAVGLKSSGAYSHLLGGHREGPVPSLPTEVLGCSPSTCMPVCDTVASTACAMSRSSTSTHSSTNRLQGAAGESDTPLPVPSSQEGTRECQPCWHAPT